MGRLRVSVGRKGRVLHLRHNFGSTSNPLSLIKILLGDWNSALSKSVGKLAVLVKEMNGNSRSDNGRRYGKQAEGFADRRKYSSITFSFPIIFYILRKKSVSEMR